jgi:RNA polymerase sigma-70 factor, ECF subfamily
MRLPSMLSDEADPEEPFRRLFDISYRPLLAYALRRGASPADAEDVVAETLLVAWRRRDEVPGDAEALPWLYGVARRVLANQRRGRVRRQRLERLLGRPPAVGELVEEEAQLAEEARMVLATSRRLSTADQEVLRLAAWEGLSHRQIALSLGCSDNAAALRLHRARLRLREALVKEGRVAGQEVVEVRR